VDANTEGLGAYAVDCLLGQIAGSVAAHPAGDARAHTLQTRLVKRGST
jgi:hypothetical protein